MFKAVFKAVVLSALVAAAPLPPTHQDKSTFIPNKLKIFSSSPDIDGEGAINVGRRIKYFAKPPVPILLEESGEGTPQVDDLKYTAEDKTLRNNIPDSDIGEEIPSVFVRSDELGALSGALVPGHASAASVGRTEDDFSGVVDDEGMILESGHPLYGYSYDMSKETAHSYHHMNEFGSLGENVDSRVLIKDGDNPTGEPTEEATENPLCKNNAGQFSISGELACSPVAAAGRKPRNNVCNNLPANIKDNCTQACKDSSAGLNDADLFTFTSETSCTDILNSVSNWTITNRLCRDRFGLAENCPQICPATENCPCVDSIFAFRIMGIQITCAAVEKTSISEKKRWCRRHKVKIKCPGVCAVSGCD